MKCISRFRADLNVCGQSLCDFTPVAVGLPLLLHCRTSRPLEMATQESSMERVRLERVVHPLVMPNHVNILALL